jgi:hypothetical protein
LSVYLMALSIRFIRTCLILSGSMLTLGMRPRAILPAKPLHKFA